MSAKPILICIDDDNLILHTMERSLKPRTAQWDIHFFSRAADALALLQDREAVVLTDWLMPEINGLEFCRRLRTAEAQSEGRRYSYVIMLTGRQETDYVVHALEQGADDFVTKPFHMPELVARIGVGMRMLDLQRCLRESNERLSILAVTDPLTGLDNRRRGVEVLEENLERVRRGKQSLSLIMLDLDHFKTVNDLHGHEGGDRLLCHVAALIRQECRKYDAVVRWGGDEILVVCPHADADEAGGVAERIRKVCEAYPAVLNDGNTVAVSASIGTVTACSGTDVQPLQLVACVDTGLYQAKTSGRNTVRSVSVS